MKSKKERLQSDCERYSQIIDSNQGTVHRADIYAAMATGIKRWIADNIDYATQAWFERVEQTVLRARQSMKQKEFGFVLDPNAIIALGDSQRVRLGHCDKKLCQARREMIAANRESQVIAADREIAAWDEVIARLKPGQTVDDLI